MLVARLLNAVVTVRGYKTALRFFGHEAADLEPTVNLLQWAERVREFFFGRLIFFSLSEI